MSTITPFDGEAISLGRGFDSLAQVPRSPVAEPNASAPSGGQTVNFALLQVETLSELRNELNVSASASFNATFGQASAAANYCKTVTNLELSVILMVKVQVLNPTETLIQSHLLPEAIKNAKAPNFFAMYGDEFIISQMTGGILIAIYQFNFNSHEEKSSFSAQANVKGGTYSASADLAAKWDSIDKSSVTRFIMFKTGGIGDIPEINQQNLIKYACAFPTAVAAWGSSRVALYTTAPLTEMTNAPKEANIHDFSDARVELNNLLQKRDAALIIQDQINEIIKYPWLYGNLDTVILEQYIHEIALYINTVSKAARDCMAKPYQFLPFPYEVPKLELPAFNVPDINFSFDLAIVGHSGQHIGAGGIGGGIIDGIQGFVLNFGQSYSGLNCMYALHNGTNWQGEVQAGTWAGQPGFTGHVISAIKIRLIGPLAKLYSVQYTGRASVNPASFQGNPTYALPNESDGSPLQVDKINFQGICDLRVSIIRTGVEGNSVE